MAPSAVDDAHGEFRVELAEERVEPLKILVHGDENVQRRKGGGGVVDELTRGRGGQGRGGESRPGRKYLEMGERVELETGDRIWDGCTAQHNTRIPPVGTVRRSACVMAAAADAAAAHVKPHEGVEGESRDSPGSVVRVHGRDDGRGQHLRGIVNGLRARSGGGGAGTSVSGG